MEGKLLTLFPPYFSLMSQSHVKDGFSYCIFAPLVYEPCSCFLWLCIGRSVWHTAAAVMFFECKKWPTQDGVKDCNFKALYVLQLQISSGQLDWLSMTENLLYDKCKDIGPSGENAWKYLITTVFRLWLPTFFFFLFPWSQFHSLYEE